MRHFKTPLARAFAYDGGNHYIEVEAAVLQSEPVTMACWFYSTSLTVGQGLIWLGDKDVSNREMYLSLRGDLAGDPVGIDVDAVGSTTRALTTTAYATNTWQHACGVFTSTTSRAAYLNGGSKGTNTGFRTAATYDRTSVGRLARATPVFNMQGRIALPAIWKVALSDDEVFELSRGAHPLTIRPDSLVALWDWTGANTEFGLRGTFPLVNNGSIPVDGPGFLSQPVLPRRRRFNSVGGGVTSKPFFFNRYVAARRAG